MSSSAATTPRNPPRASCATRHPCAVPSSTAPRHSRRRPLRRSALTSRQPRRPSRHPCGQRTSTPSAATSSSAWHDLYNSRPHRAPDRASHTLPPNLSAPLEPRQPGNSLAAARQAWLDSPHPPPLHAPDRAVHLPPPNLPAPPKPRPPGPALVAAQNRLRESVSRIFPELNLLDYYGQPQPPGASYDGAAPPPAAAAGDNISEPTCSNFCLNCLKKLCAK